MNPRQELEKLVREASQRWKALGHSQKFLVAALGLALIVALGALSVWAQNPDYTVAFTNLKQEDAGAIVAKLKESKTPYQIGDGGATIRVPASKVHEVRLEMARQGLLSGGGVGFEIFNETKFGMTDFAQKLNYQRALEGELGRTISSIAAVDSARVHIVIPQPTLFTEKEKAPSAAVMLKLKPGARLDKSQIRGITQLVSSGVEGLKPENLTIVDSQGNVLSESYDASAAGGASPQLSTSRLAYQHQYEQDAEAKVRSMLEGVLGPNKAVVKVTASFDWNQLEANSEVYSPNSGNSTVRSSRSLAERYTGAEAAAVGGVPGVESNRPAAVATAITSSLATPSAVSGYERTDTTQNYEVSRTVSRLVKAPGDLTRLSLAVLLDRVVEEGALNSLKEAVATAVGLDTARGDAITVETLSFDRSYYENEAKALASAEKTELYFTLAKIGGGIVAVLVLLFLLRSAFRGFQPRVVLTQEMVAAPVVSVARAPVLEAKNMAELEEQRKKDEEERRLRQKMQEEVQTLARNKPDAIANVMRLWLTEPAASSSGGTSNGGSSSTS